jgi:hypothetical protein
MRAFRRGVSLLSVGLDAMVRHKDEEVHRILAEAAGMLSEKTIASIDPVNLFPLSKMNEALHLLEGEQHMGKVVLSVGTGEMVPVCIDGFQTLFSELFERIHHSGFPPHHKS